MKFTAWDLMIVTFLLLWAIFYYATNTGYRFIKISWDERPGYELSDGKTIVSSR